MHKAAREGHVSTLEAFLDCEKVFDKNPADHLGKNVYQYGVDYGHLEVQRLFRNRGFSLSEDNKEYAALRQSYHV